MPTQPWLAMHMQALKMFRMKKQAMVLQEGR
jgi:hypothetical protein